MLQPPYRTKTVESIRLLSLPERERKLKQAGHNLFFLNAEDVFIDLLTDSGTNAMSDKQWAAMMRGDESYAGSRSFRNLKRSVCKITGFPHVLPVHQGRGAEHIFNEALVSPDMVVPGNKHFDTTRAHIERRGGIPLDCTAYDSVENQSPNPFQGNVDIGKLKAALDKGPVAYVLLTVTCNSIGGHPVSLENIRAVRECAIEAGVPLFLDGARFAENAYLIKVRERGMEHRDVKDIAREMCDKADGMFMSAKKDALVNIGGFIALRDYSLYRKLEPLAVLYEGFPHYGGMAGRDMEAIATGLSEGIDDIYLAHRIAQVRYLGEGLARVGIPVVQPFGGHAVYIDASRMLPHIPWNEFPGQTLAIAAYLEGGIRTVEVGSLMEGRDPKTRENRQSRQELLRLALPRRVYGQEHLDYVIKVFENLAGRADSLRGVAFSREAYPLRHFLSRFKIIS